MRTSVRLEAQARTVLDLRGIAPGARAGAGQKARLLAGRRAQNFQVTPIPTLLASKSPSGAWYLI